MTEKVKNSPENQKLRCDKIAELVTGYQVKHFNENGEWDAPELFIPLRERLYFSLTFLRSGQSDAVRKANGIIRNASYGRCTFSPMIAIQILLKYRDLLDKDAEDLLLAYVRSEMEPEAQSDFEYVGVNDNFPSMAVYVLIIGGQLLGMPEMIALGKERLGQFKALFIRRGVASEYNSPTYSSIQLLAMAEIGLYAEDEEIREMALGCQTRIWADVLGHFHKETSQIAGPYSRAYGGDSAGYTGLVRMVLYALFGDALPVNIMNTLLETENGSADGYVHNGAAFTQINAVWLTDTVYTCPNELIELALNKKYPYEMTATTEFTCSSDMPPFDPPVWPEGECANYEYPAGKGTITTYMTEDYALGTASHEFHNGVQTDSFHILYRRKAPALKQRDIGAVYARYIVNEKEPKTGMALLEDNGRKLGIQHKNTAMMLYKPKPYLKNQVSSLKLALVFPALGNSVEEVWLGNKKMTGDSLVSEEVCSVFVKDGPVYMAFHPLIATDHGRTAAVTAKKTGDYLTVSFYNYVGEARDFTMREMLLTGNGFVAEVGSQEEYGSFEAFCEKTKQFAVKDEWQATVHSRFSTLRKTSYEKDGVRIECEYSPVTEGIKQITVNGREPENPKLFISG